MTSFYKGETYAIVQAMKDGGNQPGLIQRWKAEMEAWAKTHQGPDADAIQAWLPHWQVRPFYTPAELVPLWPVLAIAVGHTSRIAPVGKSARRLEHELKFAGLRFREVNGKTYFVVERCHYWRDAPLSEFQEILNA